MRTDKIPLASSYIISALNALNKIHMLGDDNPETEKWAFRNLAWGLNELGLEMGIKPEPRDIVGTR